MIHGARASAWLKTPATRCAREGKKHAEASVCVRLICVVGVFCGWMCVQPIVAKDIADQLAAGDKTIFGCMIESNINEGRQDLVEGQADKLKYGVSITDACINWDSTVTTLQTLADGVAARRAKK